jgi:hypothetical protein
MSLKWIKNKEFVWSVIKEIIEEDNLLEYHNIILDEYEQLMKTIFKKQLNYENYTIMNKEILTNINVILQKLKTNNKKTIKKKVRIQEIYSKPEIKDEPITNEELRNTRNNLFNNRLQEKEIEFNQTMKLKPPQEIDFSDKINDEEVNIDKLMEEELKKRSYELDNLKKNYENNNAEDWIYNGNKPDDIERNKYDDIERNRNLNISIDLVDEGYTTDYIKEETKPLNSFLSKLKKIKEPMKGNNILYLRNTKTNEELKIELLKNEENYIKEIDSYIIDIDDEYIIEKIHLINIERNYKLDFIKDPIEINIEELEYINVYVNNNKYKFNNKGDKMYVVDDNINNRNIISNKIYLRIKVG